MVVSESLNIEDFKNWKLSPGNIFYKTKSDKNIRIYATGDPIDHEKFKKYLAYKDQLFIETVLNFDTVSEGKKKLSHWIGQENVIEQRTAGMDFLSWVHDNYWKEKKEAKLLDLSFIFYEIFFKLPEVQNKLNEENLDYFKRSLVASSVGSIFVMTLGYFNPKIVSDFYNIVYLLDMKIVNEFSSYNIWQGLEHDRVKDNLESVISGKEKEMIQKHVESIDLNEFDASAIHNKNLLNLIKFHHEKINGKGFPKNISENELSDLECATIFTNNLFSILKYDFKENDGIEFFKNVLTFNDRDYGRTMGRRFQKLSVNMFKSFEGAA